MMRTVVRSLPWGNAVFLMAGIVIALSLMPLVSSGIALLQDMYDKGNPVARAKLASAEKLDDETLRLRLWVTRERDCEVLQMVGFTGHSAVAMHGASVMRREDGSRPLSYPKGVSVMSRPWILSPVYGNRIWVWGYYECDGRIVKTPLVDEDWSTVGPEPATESTQ